MKREESYLIEFPPRPSPHLRFHFSYHVLQLKACFSFYLNPTSCQFLSQLPPSLFLPFLPLACCSWLMVIDCGGSSLRASSGADGYLICVMGLVKPFPSSPPQQTPLSVLSLPSQASKRTHAHTHTRRRATCQPDALSQSSTHRTLPPPPIPLLAPSKYKFTTITDGLLERGDVPLRASHRCPRPGPFSLLGPRWTGEVCNHESSLGLLSPGDEVMPCWPAAEIREPVAAATEHPLSAGSRAPSVSHGRRYCRNPFVWWERRPHSLEGGARFCLDSLQRAHKSAIGFCCDAYDSSITLCRCGRVSRTVPTCPVFFKAKAKYSYFKGNAELS